jgi:hypothetical protein
MTNLGLALSRHDLASGLVEVGRHRNCRNIGMGETCCSLPPSPLRLPFTKLTKMERALRGISYYTDLRDGLESTKKAACGVRRDMLGAHFVYLSLSRAGNGHCRPSSWQFRSEKSPKVYHCSTLPGGNACTALLSTGTGTARQSTWAALVVCKQYLKSIRFRHVHPMDCHVL